MRKLLLILPLLLTSPLFAQDILDEIAKAGCKCIEDQEISNDQEERNMQLGLCIIDAATDYKAELLEQYEIDFAKIDEHGEKLGQLVGVRMVSICPDLITSLVGGGDEAQVQTQSESGIITEINNEVFISFTVKNNEGKSTRFFWLTFIKSDLDLPAEYESLKGKSVQITYLTREFFDARILEYRNFNILTDLEILE